MRVPSHTREQMVDVQIASRGIRNPRVLNAMRTVPREVFVSAGFEKFAYDDCALPIDEGQTISQPYIVARMIEAAHLDDAGRVLEVGTGSGYAAAVLSRIVPQVYTIERHATLAETARRRFASLSYQNIDVRVGDGTRGWPEMSPFDAILVSASASRVPQALKQQLAIGARLVLPVGDIDGRQTLQQITRKCETDYEQEDLEPVSFVPLVVEQGGPELPIYRSVR